MAFRIDEIGLRDEVIAGIRNATSEDGTPDPILALTKDSLTNLLQNAPPTTGLEVFAQSREGSYIIRVKRRQLSRRDIAAVASQPDR